MELGFEITEKLPNATSNGLVRSCISAAVALEIVVELSQENVHDIGSKIFQEMAGHVENSTS